MTQMIDMLLRLSPRERGLLGLLALVVMPALLWLWLIAPLLDSRAAALRQTAEARALQLWVAERAADQAQLGRPQGSQLAPPIGISGLEQSLVAAQLRPMVTRLSGQDDGGIELGFEVVEFALLASWLSQMDPGWGYDIASLRLQRHAEEDPGLISAELTLLPQQAP